VPDTPHLDHVQCLDNRGLHRMAYWTWGRADHPHAVVCAHGLTRQGLDFDVLAQTLIADDACRVVSVDVVGRGRSDRLADPMGYQVPQYVADMVPLLARLDAQTVDWVGTSMGGLIGLGVAALAGSPLRRYVVNDIGPTIDPTGLARIAQYVGRPAQWATLDEAADALWTISQGFGPHTREQWLAFTAPQLVADADGTLRPRCDVAIGVPFAATTPEMAAANERFMWQAWDSLRLPTLVVRGADSDILSPATAAAMTERGPRAKLVEFAGVGHAPTLIAPDQVAVVRDFLFGP
jgi:pimeloyl-ACP methyl ester carboxylesterase